MKTPAEILSFYTCVPLIKIIWYMVPKIWSSADRIFLSSWAIFCPFTPLTPWKIKISKNEKNPWRCHHFTQVYQQSWSSADHHDHSFWAILSPFTHQTAQKMKISKQWEKGLEISFYTRVPNIMIILYCSWDMERVGCNFYFSFWAIFSPSTRPPHPRPPPSVDISFDKSVPIIWYRLRLYHDIIWDIILLKGTKIHGHVILFLRYGTCRM